MTSLQRDEQPNTPKASYVSPLATLSLDRGGVNGPQDSKLRGLYRFWVALRWRLSANFFARPVPWLTSVLDLKVGDLCITLPIAVVFLVVNAIGAQNKDASGTGSLPTYTLILVFALAVRNNSVLLTLTGIPFERALLYHKFFSIVTILLSALHGLAYLLDTAAETDEGSMVLTGTIFFGLMVLLYFSSLAFVRRRFFELFLRVHWILFILVMVFAVIHSAAIVLLGFVPWLLDMIFRVYYCSSKYKNSNGVIAAQQVSIKKLPDNIVRIQFPRVRADTGESFTYEAGQYAFLCVPSLSQLQWHPFTISSAPHEAFVTFHIKVLGDWTKGLYDQTTESPTPFEMLVDGPYGAVSIDIENFSTYSHVVLISGGIGITPMQSIVNRLHYQMHYDDRVELQKVKFVWSVRNRDMIEAMLGQGIVDAKIESAQTHSVMSYLPDLLLATDQRTDAVFETEIYLTSDEADLENPVDLMLQHCMHYSVRPDIANTLRTMGEQAQKCGKSNVAVLVCGSESMLADVISESIKLSTNMKIRFDVHTETFDF